VQMAAEMDAGSEAEQKKQEAKAAGLLKKEQAMERRRQEAARKQEAKAAEQACRAAEAAQRLREEAAKTTAGLAVQWDVEFARAPDQTGICMDIWSLAAGAATRRPVVIWLHGGGWKAGTHHTMPAFLRRLAESGYVIASVGYRKTGVAPFPACLQDCKAAVRWLRANGGAFGLDASRVGVVGNSAGAHLATLLGLTSGLAELEGSELGWAVEPSGVSAVVAIAGPSDLAKTCADHSSAKTPEALLLGAPVASVPAAAELASPVTHATRAGAVAGSFLLIHGDADEEVPLEQSELLLTALEAAGVDASLIRVPGGHHPKFGERDAEACLASARSSWTEALEHSVVDFFDARIGRSASA